MSTLKLPPSVYELAETIIDSLPLVVFIRDVTTLKFVVFNTASETLFGLDRYKVLDHTAVELFPEEISKMIVNKDYHILTSKQPGDTYQEYINYNGIVKILNIKNIPLLNDKNEVTHLLTIAEDITKYRQVEQRLMETKDTLELINKDLEQQAVIASGMMICAENSSLAKSKLIANISHEMRTPLNGIVGVTELLLETNLDAHQKELVEMLLHSSEHMSAVINDVLNFTKVESTMNTVKNVPINLRQLIAGTLKILELKARDKDLEFEYILDAKLPTYVSGDPFKLSQILINLVTNAVNFTHVGKIIVECKPIMYNGSKVIFNFSIYDTGIGIHKDRLSTIFNAGIDNSTSFTEHHSNIGLGLAISKQLVEAMGGIIKVDSEIGKGSHFWISVPFYSIRDINNVDKTKNYIDQLPNDLNILIAEDNDVSAKILSFTLRPLGCNICVCNTGNMVIQELNHSKYDLILMDCQMPLMDGYETTKHIRKGKAGAINRNIPIIAITACAMDDDRQKCLEVGMNDYLSKPITNKELVDAIARNLKSS